MNASTASEKVKSYRTNLHICLKLLLLILMCNLFSPDCKGQITFTVTQPRLKILNDSNLMISYDILGANADDKFYIWLEVTDSAGGEINAKTLNGDVGDNIKAGANKQIVWNIIADKIFIDNTINIEIIAEKKAVPDKKDMAEIPSDKTGKKTDRPVEKPGTTYLRVKVGKHLLKSAVFPGWGSTSLSNGKPYWIIGVAGIGCVATSVYFYYSAHSSYDDYKHSTDDNITDYYDDAVLKGNISRIFAASAGAIWLIDFGIVTIKASRINKSYRKNRTNSLSVSPSIDAYSDTRMLSLQYKF
jgi:hypothetical protein